MACEDEDDAKTKYGPAVAKMLQSRLADLDAAVSIDDLLAGHPQLIGHTDNYKIDLCDGFKLVFCANHVNNPKNATGQVDWQRVSHVKIIQIEII